MKKTWFVLGILVVLALLIAIFGWKLFWIFVGGAVVYFLGVEQTKKLLSKLGGWITSGIEAALPKNEEKVLIISEVNTVKLNETTYRTTVVCEDETRLPLKPEEVQEGVEYKINPLLTKGQIIRYRAEIGFFSKRITFSVNGGNFEVDPRA